MKDYKTIVPVATPPAPPTPDELLIHSERAGVWIPLAQNLAGGILGVGTAMTITLWKLLGVDLYASLEVALLSGGMVFGIATMIRMFRDEIRFLVSAWGEKQDRLTREALHRENAELKELVKQLEAKGAITDAMTALLTARKLIFQAYGQRLSISREACAARGMTRPTWEAGNKVLRTAGVVNGKSELLLPTEVEAWAAVMKSQDTGMGHYDVAPDGSLVKTPAS